MRMAVTPAEVRAAFDYDPKTGALTRKDKGRMRRPHTGTVNHRKDTAYAVLCIDGRKVYAHRAAWMYVHGDIAANLVIDHIDGNGLNNRMKNLRLVTKSLNQRNRRDQVNLRGVYQYRGGYVVQLAGKYAGWSRDFFEACCIRKSREARSGYINRSAV